MPRKSFWARLPFGVRMTTAGLGVLAVVAGAAGGIAALTGKNDPDRRAGDTAMTAPLQIPGEPRTATGAAGAAAAGAAGAGVAGPGAAGAGAAGAGTSGAGAPGAAAAGAAGAPGKTTGLPGTATGDDATGDRGVPQQADRTATRAPRTTGGAPESPAGAGATTGTRTEQVTETIPFRTKLVRDPSLPRGTKRVQSQGVPGERVLRYDVTYVDGRETGRRLTGSTVTREPQPRVIAYGNSRWNGDQGGRGDFGGRGPHGGRGDFDGRDGRGGPGGPGGPGGRDGRGWRGNHPGEDHRPGINSRAGNNIGIGNGRRFATDQRPAGRARSGTNSWRGNDRASADGGFGGRQGSHRAGGWAGGCGPGAECRPIGRHAACSDESTPAEEELVGRKLGLLTDDQLNAMQVTLPCNAVTQLPGNNKPAPAPTTAAAAGTSPGKQQPGNNKQQPGNNKQQPTGDAGAHRPAGKGNAQAPGSNVRPGGRDIKNGMPGKHGVDSKPGAAPAAQPDGAPKAGDTGAASLIPGESAAGSSRNDGEAAGTSAPAPR
ncbi:G5 domain-containing protein [Actinoplanes sp. RD1]|uniref:G5 domain-containing protein n=1 Tax=Actinoplanes sp. RD1 TaxID=3064538 RepID=UPI0027427A2C|nr:G5 domain-containing protein [Actinoplanes sp. RD1]